MDNQKDYSCLEHNGRILSKQIEMESDFQETIPAYCDDIYRVVKCTGRSVISSADISYNEIKIHGKHEICLTYFNENSNLCYTDFEEDFTKTVNADNLSETAFICADVFDKYTNYRVINQRRIDIHTSSIICLNVYDKITCPTLCSCDNSKLKHEKVRISNVLKSIITKIDFDEEFGLPSGYDAIKRVISYSAFAALNETKIIKDKALIKAIVNVSVLYTSDNSDESINAVSYSFNVSKIIECVGIEENDIVLSGVKIGGLFVKTKAASGENINAFEIFGDVVVNSLFISERECDLVTDGYIPEYSSECLYSEYSINEAGSLINENKLINMSFPLPDGITKIYDLGVSLGDISFKNEKLSFNAQITAVCENISGEVISITSGDEAEINYSGYNASVAFVNINSFDYSISAGNTLDLRLNAQIGIYTFNNKKINVLNDINAEEKLEKSPSLTIYFGKENKDVWDIAKSFSSDEQRIIEENSLSGNTLESNRILIIPKA